MKNHVGWNKKSFLPVFYKKRKTTKVNDENFLRYFYVNKGEVSSSEKEKRVWEKKYLWKSIRN